MQFGESQLIIEHNLNGLGPEGPGIDHMAFLLCTAGECRLKFNGKDMMLRQGEAMILPMPMLVTEQHPSADFSVSCAYVNPEMLSLSSVINELKLEQLVDIYSHPIFTLSPEELEQLDRDFADLERRMRYPEPALRGEIIYHVLHILILDYAEIYASAQHSHVHGNTPPSTGLSRNISVLTLFMDLMVKGSYLKHRRIDYYAEQLNVTPKYLSAVTRYFTGRGAHYWINRFTVLHICVLLRTTSQPLTEIAMKLGFSSPAHFKTFFRNQMGVNPSEYRSAHLPG